MSGHVYVKVKMRAVDARRFVREFEKEYGDQIIVHKWQLPQMFTNHKWQKFVLVAIVSIVNS